MNVLEKIEKKFQFSYPELYKKMYRDQFLDWGEFGSDGYKETYCEIKKNPPFLFFAEDFEILSFDQIIMEMESFVDFKDYRRIHPEYQLIPFAQNGTGDLYCFLYSEEYKGQVPVVFMWYDSNNADIKSRSFQDFIFRELLEMVVDIEGGDVIMEGSFKENTVNMLKTHKKYISDTRLKIIEEIYSRELRTFSSKGLFGEREEIGLISYEELRSLLQSEIGFDGLNKTFKHELSVPVVPVVKDDSNNQ
ncbi:SMI1/KNR4 family protein [Chryseobacterium sp.]|uniref:SMI1/KNR4 family protein n=1 Tax=Chryseobacterium sp. TaxID=1871047 RepID=UPI0025BDF226|nr:SMI1/KNR4 family protein [Chryseobacterium sp.]